MDCPWCGARNQTTAERCSLCGAELTPRGRPLAEQPLAGALPPVAGQVGPAPPPPVNPLGWSIAATFCCCQPFGIVSIVYAAQISGRWNLGDWAGAHAAARNARLWAWLAFGCGGLIQLAYLTMLILGAVLSEL